MPHACEPPKRNPGNPTGNPQPSCSSSCSSLDSLGDCIVSKPCPHPRNTVICHNPDRADWQRLVEHWTQTTARPLAAARQYSIPHRKCSRRRRRRRRRRRQATATRQPLVDIGGVWRRETRAAAPPCCKEKPTSTAISRKNTRRTCILGTEATITSPASA